MENAIEESSKSKRTGFVDLFTLFTSASTLVCCALPALLVAIGAGSVMASLATNVPGLVWLSRHKVFVFLAAGFLLLINGFIKFRSRNVACPTDEALSRACRSVTSVGNTMYLVSIIIYAIGGFFAFVAPRIL